MEKKKTSKKALRGLITDSMKEAIASLQLPEPTKKVDKILQRNAKKLASVFADLIRREDRKRKKADKFMEDGLIVKSRKLKKSKASILAKRPVENVTVLK